VISLFHTHIKTPRFEHNHMVIGLGRVLRRPGIISQSDPEANRISSPALALSPDAGMISHA